MGNTTGSQCHTFAGAGTSAGAETYFCVKKQAPVLLAFVVGPQNIPGYHLHRVIIATRHGIYQYSLRTGKLQRTCRAQVELATHSECETGGPLLAFAAADHSVTVMDAETFQALGLVRCDGRVSALQFMTGGFVAIGTHAGDVFLVKPGEGDSQMVHVCSGQEVTALCYAQHLHRSFLFVGFSGVRPPVPIQLFAFNSLLLEPKAPIEYRGLTGSCGSLEVVPSEKLLLALCPETGEMHVWDLIHRSLLLKMKLWPEADVHCLRVVGVEDMRVKLAVGGKEGLLTGELHIAVSNASWTPRSRSQLQGGKAVKNGGLTSLVVDNTNGMMIYGDDLGQVWLLTCGASTGKTTLNSPRASQTTNLYSEA